MITRLLLVRHAHPQAYIDGVVAGPKGCTGLSEAGRRQAEALAARLARTGELGEEPLLVSSVLPRAIETAAAVAQVLGRPEWDQHCDLCEVHPGEQLDGLPFDQVQSSYASPRSIYEPWGPGAESWAEFVARVGRHLLQLVDDHAGETILAVCHGGIIDAAFRILGHSSMNRRINWQPAYTSITEWVQEGEEWLLARYNDHAHLEGVDGPVC